MRTTMLASAHRTAQVLRSVDLYLRPPIDHFGMLEFEHMEAVAECGYRYALEAAAGWKGGVPPVASPGDLAAPGPAAGL
jgi:predicted acylesterase/phospholipase RssA